MNHTYKIDAGKNLVRVKYTGPVSVGELIAFIDRLLDDPLYRSGLNSISDLTEGVFDWSLTDIDRFRKYVMSIETKTGECKWALVSRGGVTERNARLFIVLNEIDVHAIQAKLFDNFEDAERWATIPVSNAEDPV